MFTIDALASLTTGKSTVDHRGRFTDVYVGWPGRVHDARVFANSSLYQRGQSGNLLPDWKEQMDERDIPLVHAW